MNRPERFELFILPEGKSKVEFIPDTKMPNAGVFIIEREDHTLGNLLRMQILVNPRVLFCGYKVPHPLEHKVELRIQTTEETNPRQVLLEAIDELKQMFEQVKGQFSSP
eukprot:c17926_g1_i2.p1 GENE.c17926_g1_i2~~c17926_g1_i2.p1  ORF type:complete len:117 (+),score=31.22 c17926_g1_i2:25-351(+)